ncbi:MAG: hydantoinase/oxoprolinase family protein [Anaerolineae bacterium]
MGGTFTDCVRLDDSGMTVHKRPSTPADPSLAVVAGVDVLDGSAEASVAHGTTVATNALLERRGARTAFVATAGFADLLALGRGERSQLYELSPLERPVLVPREMCFEVDERVAADGVVVRALSATSVDRLREAIAERGAEAVAVCLLFSYLYPEHERAVGEALVALPEAPHVSLSIDVLPEVREYERASTTAVNAYVAPVVSRYLRRLERAVAPRPLTVMASHAGTLSPGEAARLPVATVLSGPAAGVSGALALASRAGRDHLVTFDMGGTSTDVALCDGAVPYAATVRIGGLPINREAVDVHTVGAGGGSIARADEGGALRVGPESAGAVPGPASYGLGGRRATVTDANVVLGRLPAGVPLAGGLRLDRRAAADALAEVGSALGLSPVEAALGTIAVVNATMERALRTVSVERGFPPEEFTLVAFGGAGPLHVCELADALGARDALVPAVPGALSAIGLATSPSVTTTSRSVVRAADAPAPDYGQVYRALEDEAREALGGADVDFVERTADLRYRGQSWELTVPWADRGVPLDAFAAAHRRRYGYDRPGEAVEVVTLRIRCGRDTAAPLPGPPPLRTSPATRAQVVLADGSMVPARVLDRWSLAPGERLEGPAVICQEDATTFVAPRWSATVGAYGDLLLSRVG